MSEVNGVAAAMASDERINAKRRAIGPKYCVGRASENAELMEKSQYHFQVQRYLSEIRCLDLCVELIDDPKVSKTYYIEICLYTS